MLGALVSGVFVFLAMAILIFLKKINVSLELDEPLPYIYGFLVLGIGLLSLNYLMRIKKHVSIMTGFVNYFAASFVLIIISAFQSVFYELIEELGVPDYQIVYLSHFLFYGALTLMFLAFVRLTDLGGIYKEAEEYNKKLPSHEPA